jgi:tungstate transport system permease protein
MELMWQGITRAFWLIVTGDPEVLEIALLSLKISVSATLLALLLGIPVGSVLALTRFPGRGIIVSLINTGMGLPPVVVGLVVTILIWRDSLLGFMRLLYTPAAMILAQIVIAFPIVAGLTLAALQSLNPKLRLQLLSLGASRFQLTLLLLKEARLPLLAAVMAGFGGVISEIGAVLMVGGNIKGQTRVLTTSIVLETRMGNFEMAIALGILLLLLTFAVNLILTRIQQREQIMWPKPF